MQEVTAKLKDQATGVTVTKNFGSNLAECTALFGEEVVFSKAVDALVIDCQSNMRRLIRKGGDDAKQENIQKVITAWVPKVGAAGPRKSPVERVTDIFKGMTPEDRKALLASLKAQEKVA